MEYSRNAQKNTLAEKNTTIDMEQDAVTEKTTKKIVIKDTGKNLSKEMASHRQKLAIVIMASGYSERFGSNKLLEPFLDKPLFTYAVDLADSSEADTKIIVTRYNPIVQYVKENTPTMNIVWNTHPERGISESIHLGIEYLKSQKDYEQYAGCCFMVCDQPLLQNLSLQELFKSFYINPEGIHMCVTKEKEGNPVIFPKMLLEELMELQGDKGGKRIVKKHPELLHKVYVAEQELSDMDYKEDKINLERNKI